MLRTAGEVSVNSFTMFSNGLLCIDTPVLTNQQKLTVINSMWALDTIKRTFQDRDE